MKLLEVAEAQLDPSIEKKVQKTMKALKAEAARFGKNQISIKVMSPFKVEFTIEFQRFMHPEDLKAMWPDLQDALKKSDTEGHIHKIEENGSGENFVDAILSGLRPGMMVKADAFFPTVIYEVTWKQIVSRKG